jgi:polyphosphate kinase 2 (PPK2 family)
MGKLKKDTYEKELELLQIELVKLQEWVKKQGLKVAVIFEGRDAEGKGGTIKRITEPLNPRVCQVVALPAPTEKEKNAVVFPALCLPPSLRRRNRSVRSKLVQPCWC